METPKVETPTTPTDKVETPAVETPKVETPVAPETKDKQPEGKEPTSLMDEVDAEEKTAEQKENERLLNAKDEDLNDADKAKKAELVKAQAEAEKANAVPEKYEFKVPEGFTLDQALVDKVTPIFKDGKVNQGTAQKLVDLYAETLKTAATQAEATQKANFDAFVEDLKKETVAELSKDGKDYKKELAFAAKTRDRFMPKELVEKLNVSGLANDVHLVKFLISIGQKISEGTVVEGSQAGAGQKDPLEVLYDHDKK